MSTGGKPQLVLLSDVEPEEVRWLWTGRIPLGKLTILDGDPGTSKTTLILNIGARLSRGDEMPDGSTSDLEGPRGTVLLTSEDGLADTIRPRLDAAGADAGKFVAMPVVMDALGKERLPTVQDVGAMEDAINAVNAALVVFDPLSAYLGDGVDSHRDSSVRARLAALGKLAEDTGVAIVGIRHLNKKADVESALYRGGGSIAFTASARSVLLLAHDPDDPDRSVLASTKCNIAEPQPSLAYRTIMKENGAVGIEWLGVSEHRADELLGKKAGRGRSKLDSAKEWLCDQLKDGQHPATQILRRARLAGHAEKTLRRAARDLDVEKVKLGFEDGWAWSLSRGENLTTFVGAMAQEPPEPVEAPKAATQEDSDHLRRKIGTQKVANEMQSGRLGERPVPRGLSGVPGAEGGPTPGPLVAVPTSPVGSDWS